MKQNKRPSKRKKNFCAKCWKFTETENHHVLPRRHFKRSEYHRRTIRLCADCHREIEKILPFRRLEKDIYIEIHKLWLMDVDITIL